MAAKAKETKQAAPTPAPEEKPTKEAKAAKENSDRFIRCFDGKKAVEAKKADGTPQKLAPQLQVIANTLEAAGKEGMSRSELVAALEGVIVTRQPIGRIVSYYQKDLQSFGLATLAKS